MVRPPRGFPIHTYIHTYVRMYVLPPPNANRSAMHNGLLGLRGPGGRQTWKTLKCGKRVPPSRCDQCRAFHRGPSGIRTCYWDGILNPRTKITPRARRRRAPLAERLPVDWENAAIQKIAKTVLFRVFDAHVDFPAGIKSRRGLGNAILFLRGLGC